MSDGATLDIRRAGPGDIPHVLALDPLVPADPSRRPFIQRSVSAGQAFLALKEGQVIGYGVLDYHFFDCGFVSMLMVAPEFRRQGIGSALMACMEEFCQTEKLFTSTNESNTTMQALLEKRGYVRSGIVENLDEGDPEWIYFKRVG